VSTDERSKAVVLVYLRIKPSWNNILKEVIKKHNKNAKKINHTHVQYRPTIQIMQQNAVTKTRQW